ncbi:SdpI family protein [Candidatus Nanosalina sp. VS9-1]|uniref:SdpI family protein n=1 Tax=Candidatus Nanosalina sp. VS9-1 TaxID=3388566 RepID=UPI0039E1B096
MELEKHDYISGFTGLLLAAITIYGWINLPDQIAIHFNAAGQPDNVTGKLFGLLMMPAMFLGLYSLFKALPRVDPLGENIQDFKEQYQLIISAILGFLTYIQALIVSWNLGYSFSISQALVPGIAALYYIMGVVIGEARQNWFIGIRTPWTLSDEEVWKKTHERCGPLFKVAAVITLVAVILPDYFILLTVAPVLAVSLYSVLYSYREYQKQK